MVEAIMTYRGQLPHLKCIIVYDDQVPDNSYNVISWADAMKLGKDMDLESEVLERQKRMAINQGQVK